MFHTLKKKIGIHAVEGQRITLMFLYIFFIIASLLILKPVRTALFLTEFGAEQLPFVFMLVALFSGVVAVIYFRLTSKFSLRGLISLWLVFSILIILGAWILLSNGYDATWFIYTSYIWVAIYGVICASQFWLLANYVFNAREAKRAFGVLGAGAISGGIFGGYLTNILVPFIGTTNLLLICILFICFMLVILNVVWVKYAKRNMQASLKVQRRKIHQLSTDSPIKLILASKHVTYMSLISGIGVLVAVLVDYQFSAIASENIQNEDQLTAFFGLWYSNISLFALFIQFFLTGNILKRFGVGPSLYFLPSGILIGAAVVLLIPGLGSVVFIKMMEGGFKQSINKAGSELLSLPLPTATKNRIKTFTDVLVPNSAEGIGGILLTLLTVLLKIPMAFLSVIVLLLIGVWMLLIGRVRHEYVNSFRQAIDKRIVDSEDITLNINDASATRIVERVLETENSKQIMYVLRLLEDTEAGVPAEYLERLMHSPSDRIKAQLLRIAAKMDDVDFEDEALGLVNSGDEEVSVSAIYYLCNRDEDPIERIRVLLKDEAIQVQAAAGIAATRIHRENPEIRKRMNVVELWEEVALFQETMDLSPAEDEYRKIYNARIIGMIFGDDLNEFLHDLLKDDSTAVRRAAIEAAGLKRNEEFVPHLIDNLNTKLVKSYARSSLSEYGDTIIPILSTLIDDPDEKRAIRFGAIKVLSMIGTPKAASTLIDKLEGAPSGRRYALIKAINNIRDDSPNLKLDIKRIDKEIQFEIKERRNLLEVLRLHLQAGSTYTDSSDLSNQFPDYKAAGKLLERALEERLSASLERIFRLLGLRYSQADIYNAYLGIQSNNAVLHANAIEFLDSLLDFQQKRVIMPLLESEYNASLFQRLHSVLDESTPISDYVTFAVEGPDAWLSACSLYFVAHTPESDYSTLVNRHITSPDHLIRETAEYAAKMLKTTN